MAKSSQFVKSFLLSGSNLCANVNNGIPGKIFNIPNSFNIHRIQMRFYSPEPIKRFYKDVNVVQIIPSTRETPGAWGVNLDNRQLRTPHKRLFRVDNEAVAHAVANEWALQPDIVQMHTMHMTALANTHLDNPFHKSKVDMCNDILTYLPLDTVLYRHEENERLWELQRELWDPILHWFQQQFDVKLPIVAGNITPPIIPEESLTVLRRELMSHRFDAILGLQFAVESVKSLVLAMGVAKLHLTTAQALRLSRLELDFQTNHWGSVEWAHDLENNDTASRFSAGILFFTLNTYAPFRHTQKIDPKSIPAFGNNSGKEHHKHI